MLAALVGEVRGVGGWIHRQELAVCRVLASTAKDILVRRTPPLVYRREFSGGR